MITAASILKPRVTLAVLEQRAGRSLPATCKGTLAERLAKVVKAENRLLGDKPKKCEKAHISNEPLATRISNLLRAAQPKPAKKEYGCLMAIAPESMRQKLVKWAEKNIPDADVDPKHGRETESHVTIYFGFNEGFNDFDKLAGLRLNYDPSIKLTLGKITRFECPEYDVLKVDIESPESERWNRRIGEEFADQVTPSEHDYHPHMTLCYLKKGKCKELDGSDVFEGETFSVKKLLYSECERKGRTTVHLSDKPSEPMKATDHSGDATEKVMPPEIAAARLRAQHIYEAAALAAIAAVEAKKKATKEQKRKDEAAILLLLLMAGEDSYRETHTALGKAEPTATVPTPPELDAQAEEFAEQRQTVLHDFSGRLADTIRQTRDEAADAGTDPVKVARELRRKVSTEAGVMADTEAQVTLGSVQLDRLKRAGFSSAYWRTQEDEKVRAGHVENSNAGAVELGKPFPDSCRFPGDPQAPIECVANCRCWLEGASRKPIA